MSCAPSSASCSQHSRNTTVRILFSELSVNKICACGSPLFWNSIVYMYALTGPKRRFLFSNVTEWFIVSGWRREQVNPVSLAQFEIINNLKPSGIASKRYKYMRLTKWSNNCSSWKFSWWARRLPINVDGSMKLLPGVSRDLPKKWSTEHWYFSTLSASWLSRRNASLDVSTLQNVSTTICWKSLPELCRTLKPYHTARR